jgi:hypothetical protein
MADFTCNHPACCISIDHTHGMNVGVSLPYLQTAVVHFISLKNIEQSCGPSTGGSGGLAGRMRGSGCELRVAGCELRDAWNRNPNRNPNPNPKPAEPEPNFF